MIRVSDNSQKQIKEHSINTPFHATDVEVCVVSVVLCSRYWGFVFLISTNKVHFQVINGEWVICDMYLTYNGPGTSDLGKSYSWTLNWCNTSLIFYDCIGRLFRKQQINCEISGYVSWHDTHYLAAYRDRMKLLIIFLVATGHPRVLIPC